jgi:hypothetical protein
MKKFIVTGVSTLSFDNQSVTLENESAHVTLRLKDQKLFNILKKGDKIDLFGVEPKSKAKVVKLPTPPAPPDEPEVTDPTAPAE